MKKFKIFLMVAIILISTVCNKLLFGMDQSASKLQRTESGLESKSDNKSKEFISDDKIIDALLINLPKGWKYFNKDINYYDPCGIKALFSLYFINTNIEFETIDRDQKKIKNNPSFLLIYYPKFSSVDWEKYKMGIEKLKANPHFQYSIYDIFAETNKYTITMRSVGPNTEEILQYIKKYYHPFLIKTK